MVTLIVTGLFSQHIFGQTGRKNLITVHFSLGDGVYTTDMKGGGEYDIRYYYSIGFDYARALSKSLGVSSGLEYTYVSMRVTSAFIGGAEDTPHEEHLTLTTTIPIQLKYYCGKYFYLNGGMFFNVLARTSGECSVQSRNGVYQTTHNLGMLLGCGFGVGFEHEIVPNFVFSLNPYVRWNGIGEVGSFYQTQLTGYRFFQGGVRLGVGYKF